ncbi:MAG: type II toxin-antitoxin system VapC family toxin [Geminicoccaceae bacterium]
MLVLDTCALLDLAWARPFPPDARHQLDAAIQRRQALVPMIVAVEIAQKAWSGRLRLPDRPAQWFAAALRNFDLRELPFSAAVAFGAYNLPEPFHRDPADRLVVAQARIVDAPILTCDRKILAYAAAGHVAAIGY